MSFEQIYVHESRYLLKLAKYPKSEGKLHGDTTEFHRYMTHTVTPDCKIQNNAS